MSSPSPSRLTTLLTGSTGLIGRYLLADLTRSRLPVAVLVRSNRYQSASARIEAVLTDLERRTQRTFVRPVILDGDLTQPHLGLSRQQQDWVARHCGRVLHSAASLSFKPAAEHPDGEPYRTNVEGTERLLKFCRDAQIHEWHYVSTAYVCGLRSGRVYENERSVGQSFANDYEHSKVTTENALHAAEGIESLTVYRPSIVIDTALGSEMSDKSLYNTFATFRMLCQQFGIPQQGEWLAGLGLRGDERKNVVRADWVARMIVQILRHPELHDRTYHLTVQHGLSVADMERGFRSVVEESGLKPRSTVNRPSPEALNRLAAPFVETFGHYFKDDPQFDQTNMEHALAVCAESPCSEATVEDIHDLSRDQLKARKPLGCNGEVPISPVIMLLHARASWSTGEGERRMGLIASGCGGGEWTVRTTGNAVVSIDRGGAELCPVRLYARVETWNLLLEGTASTVTAIEHGQLIIETDDHVGDTDVATHLLTQLQDDLARTRRPLSADDRDEVLDVC